MLAGGSSLKDCHSKNITDTTLKFSQNILKSANCRISQKNQFFESVTLV